MSGDGTRPSVPSETPGGGDSRTSSQIFGETAPPPGLTCGCCPTCGALPGHQYPATGQIWQHRHTVANDQSESTP